MIFNKLNKSIKNKVLSKIKTSGFTLVELVISITISTIVIAGLFYFLVKINLILDNSQSKSSLYFNMTDFIEKVKSKKNVFGSGNIIVDNPTGSGFDTLLFTNKKQDSGFIIGVVNVDSMKLDNNFSIYGNKVLGIKQLTNYQITNIFSTGTVYDLIFYEDNIYPNLHIKDFSVIGYNSGEILEISVQIQESYNKKYDGKNINFLPDMGEFTTMKLIF